MHSHQFHQSPVGRFAPSPTGPLHFGTLVAALGSYLVSKSRGGSWLLRIEDIDRPRVVAGAASAMLRLLEQLGFAWDGPVTYQSQRTQRYQEILDQFKECGLLYVCTCSRREILASAPHPGEEGPLYPGTCRTGPAGTRREQALRLRVPEESVAFDDRVFGRQEQNLARQVGDFVLHRADGIYAYQLAVVADDFDSGVTEVVRGADLLSSTPRQIYLWRCLGGLPPAYLHLPLVLGQNQDKLSKRHGNGVLVRPDNGGYMLWRALEFLGQAPPEHLASAPAREILAWALESFTIPAIPAQHRQLNFIDEDRVTAGEDCAAEL